jgi:putative DNA primase/helicase
MRARGLGQSTIEAALRAHNQEHCDPLLDDDEVRQIARSISNYPPGSPYDVLRTLTDAGNAERFAKQWGDRVRYVPELRQWLVWSDERQWQIDATNSVMEMAKRAASDIYREGDLISDTDVRKALVAHSAKSQQAPRLEAMLMLAQSIPTLVAPITKLDADPWVLGVENGTLDLREGTLRPARREDYITRVAPVAFDAEADCPTFLQFLREIMGGDQQLVDYLQRLTGYILTGDTSEEHLFFLYGTGANGKSTLLNVLKALLGPQLCRQTPSETIMARHNRSGATPEVACLHGTRAVMTTEVDEGSLLSESLVKQMTGRDPVPARHLYGKPFEFVPWFKLMVAGNHKPGIRGSDEGIWRRIQLIPFEVTIAPERRDPRLGEKLRSELPGILNWALVGCRAWLCRRLDPPPAVLDAVAEYREDMDILGQWVADACETGPDLEVQSSAAYLNYRAWAEGAGCRPWTNAAFGRKMQERYKRKRAARGNMYIGIALRPPAHDLIPKARVLPLGGV